MGVLLAVALTILASDIISKVAVVATLSNRPPVRLLGGLLTLRVDRNPGAAFSIGTSMTIVFSAIALGVIIFILRTSRRIHSVSWAITLGLLLGGATGNLTDRLFRSPGPLRGYVVDWIQLPHWPVFNVSDSSIVCGGILAVLLAGIGRRIDGTRPDRHAEVADEVADGHVAGGQVAEGMLPGGAAADAPVADAPAAAGPVAGGAVAAVPTANGTDLGDTPAAADIQPPPSAPAETESAGRTDVSP